MTALHLLPAFLSLVLLGAHFLRGANYAFLAVAIFAGLIMAVRTPWARRTVQAVLALGVVEWLRTLTVLVAARVSADLPFARLAAILGGVVVVTSLAAVALESERVKRFYRAE
jgi:hypothetical protein